MKVLIVDDLPVNRRLLRAMLEAEGQVVLEAEDGVEALRVLSAHTVDGVISDILMPRMDGYRLCHEVRANISLCELPFVFYTSTFVSPGDQAMALRVGADKYLTKPAPIGTIMSALRDACALQYRSLKTEALPEFELLRVYSDRLVAKLEEKNLELEQRLAMSALSADVGAALIRGQTLGDILGQCAETMKEGLRALAVSIWTCEKGRNTLEWQASAGIPIPEWYGERPIADGGFCVARVATGRKAVFQDCAAGCVAIPKTEFCPEAATAFAGYPLIVGQELLGVIAIFAREPLAATEALQIASVANAIALGIERKWAEEELRQALAEKTTLLQEVHHRVKNNLQVVCSLLAMQMHCEGPEDSLGPLAEAHGRVVAMSLIHEQIYRSNILSDLDFGLYMKTLADSVFAAYCGDPSRVLLQMTVEPIRLTVEQAIPCGLILNELLSNSLKHGFNDGRAGFIRVSLAAREDGSEELAVVDNGVGFPPGFEWKSARSLGLKIVQTLAHQMRAELTGDGKGGASFRLNWRPARDARDTHAAATSA